MIYLYKFDTFKANVITASHYFTTSELGYPAIALSAAQRPYPGVMPAIAGPFLTANIKHSALSYSSEKSSGQVSLTVPRDFPIANFFRIGYPSATIFLTIFCVEEDGTPPFVIFVGRVRSCELANESSAVLQANHIADMLSRIGLTPKFQPTCPWPLYGPGCWAAKVPKPLLVTGVSADGRTVSFSSSEAFPDGYFARGLAEFELESRAISANSGTTLTLLQGIDTLAPGDTLTAFRGCNRLLDGCRSFNNVNNFGGFQHRPQDSNPFRDGVL